jgi:Flp pilus assembly protein TadD, contains TPR repeats
VPSESLYQYIPKYRDFSQEIAQSEYTDLMIRFHAAYALFPKYELMAGGREFSYYVDFVRTSDNKNLFIVEKIGSIENLGRLLDSCITCMQKNAQALKPDQFTGSFKVSLLGDNNKNILKNCKQLGTLLLNDIYLKSENPVKIAKAYKTLTGNNPGMFLALYAGGIAHMKINDFTASAELLGDFVKAIADYAPVFPAVCKSYRMCKKFDEAQKCFEMAKNAGATSIQLLLEKALTFSAIGDSKKAGEIYAAILKVDPNEPSALLFCALQNNDQNRPAEALGLAERLLAASPQNGRALLEKGRSLWLLKKYGKAGETLRLAQLQLPDDPLPLLYLGDLSRQTGDFASSSAFYEKAMAMMPADPYTGLKAAEAYTLAGNLKNALSTLQKIEPKFPGNAMLLKKMGLLEYQLADRENARKHLEKYNETGEKDATVFMSLASIYSGANEYDKAIDLYTRALMLCDDKNPCEMALSKLYLKKGEATKAIHHLSNIINRDPDFDHVNKYMAQAQEMTGDKKKAVDYYEKETSLYGDKTEFQKKLAPYYFELNNMVEAEKEYLKLIKTDTANSEAYFRLAIINLKKGNVEKADDYCSLGARYAGGDADLYFQIGQGYMNSDMPEKAVGFYSKSVAISGRNVEVWRQLAAAFLKMHNDSAAAEACIKVFEFDNANFKDYLVKAAGLYGHLGKTGKAKELYDKFLGQGFSSQSVNAELAAIEFMNKNYKRVIDLQKDLVGKASLEQALMLAESYCATGQFDEALPWCARVLDKSPDNRKALELCALANEKLGDTKKALLIQQKLMGLPGGSAQWRQDQAFHAGQLYEDQNQKDLAIRAYEKNINDFPDDMRNYERAAAVCMADKKWKHAEGLLENAVKLTGATPLMRKMLAQSFAAQGNRINAVAQYKQYLSLSPEDSATWNELGTVLFEQEHYAEAKEVLQKATTLMPRNFSCFSLLGSCCMKTGTMAEAIVPLEKAHAINRNDVQVMTNLSQCYRSTDDKKKQIALLLEWMIAEPQNVKVLKDCGELLLGDGRTREAVGVLENACSADSIDVYVHVLLAKGYDKLGKPGPQLAHLEKAIAYDSSNADIQYEMGRFFNARKQYSRAQPYLEKAVALDSLNAAAHYEYSCLLRAQKKFALACDNAQAAAQCEPYNTIYLMQQVQTAYLCGKKDIAFTIIQALYAKDPSSLEILQWAGLLFKECGSVETAKQILEKAVSMGSSCASCYKNLGDIYRSDANYEKAIKAYGQALAVGSFDEGAALGLGIAFLYSGDASRARQMFEKTVQQVPACDEALYWLCSMYFGMDKTEKAKELFSRLSNGRKSSWIHCIQGELSEAGGKTDEALVSFTVAATVMPENSIAHAGAGRIHLTKQEYEKAKDDFGRALARDQHNVRFLLGLGEACEGLGQNDTALGLYMRVASKSPKEPDVYLLLGNVLSKQQDHQKSADVYKKGLSCCPENARLYYALGHEYRLLAQIGDAVNAYKKAVKFSKDDDAGAAEAYRELGDICFYELKDSKEAKKYYQKYMKSGGTDEKVVQFVASMKD